MQMMYLWGKNSIKEKSANWTNVHDNAQLPYTLPDGDAITDVFESWTYIFLTVNRVMSPSWFRPLPQHQPQGDPVIKRLQYYHWTVVWKLSFFK